MLWCLSVSYWVPSRSCETSLEHAIDRINVAPIFECFDRDTHAQIEWRDQAPTTQLLRLSRLYPSAPLSRR